MFSTPALLAQVEDTTGSRHVVRYPSVSGGYTPSEILRKDIRLLFREVGELRDDICGFHRRQLSCSVFKDRYTHG